MVIVFDGLDNPWPDEGLLRCIPAPRVPETAGSGLVSAAVRMPRIVFGFFLVRPSARDWFDTFSHLRGAFVSLVTQP